MVTKDGVMQRDNRFVFYVSDSTGITVEALGRSVLSQFGGVTFNESTLAFVDDEDKAQAAAATIRQATEGGKRAIVFCTFADDGLAAMIKDSGALTLDCLEIFIDPLAQELQKEPLHISGGRFTSAQRGKDYQRRIDALNYTMSHDDGVSVRDFSKADIILIGVSRSGKTPTSLYLALHYGIFAANYPLVDEDLVTPELPTILADHSAKLYGLNISPQRLAQIRGERRPGSRYAEPDKCRQEIAAARRMFEANGVPHLDVTKRSIEELASKILQEAKLPRYL